MLKSPYSGKFIVLEGLDGAGKSTQAALLANDLSLNGKKACLTREPSQFSTGGIVRSRLLNEWQSSPECLQLLFAADRAEHLEKEVFLRLQEGAAVVCDRYFLSSLAYGAVDSDLEWLAQINSRFVAPDLMIYLNMPANVCADRILANGKSVELFERVEILEKVAQNYGKAMKMFENEMDIAVVDGNKKREDVFGDIKKLIENVI